MEEVSVPVCIFCSNPVSSQNETCDNNPPYLEVVNFVKEVLHINDKVEFKELEKLQVCNDCGNAVRIAVEKKCGAETMEKRVKELQAQLEEAMQQCKGQMKEFHEQMKKIEEILKHCDVGRVEQALGKCGKVECPVGIEVTGQKENSLFGIVDTLRKSIFQVIRELDEPKPSRKGRRGKRKRRMSSEPLMPLMHCAVKIEGQDGTEEAEAVPKKALIQNMAIPEFVMGTLIKEEPLDEEEYRAVDEDGMIVNDDDGFEPEVIEEVVVTSNARRRPRRRRKASRKVSEGGDDDIGEELEEEEFLDTSDDEFCLAEEDLGSESESTSESSSEEDTDSEDEDGEDYGRKKEKKKVEAKTERKKREPKNNPNSKKSRKAAYSKMLDSVNFSNMSKLKRKLIQRVLHKKYRRPCRKPKTPGKEEVDDPRLEHFIEYNPTKDTLSLDGIPISIIEEKNAENEDILCLQCSICQWTASPTHNSRHPVDSFIYNHIAGQHLNLFQCVQCGSNLGGYKQYSDHVLGHRMGFACDVCGRPLGGAQALARHKWSHLNEQEAAELVAKGLKDPREKKESTKFYPCPTCGKVFPQRCQLRKHEKVHAEVRERITCEICGKLFLPSGFISHKRYYCFPEGVEQPRISCPMCPKVFKNKQFMQVHMDRAHNTERNHKCPQCGKGFKTKKDLMTHEETHTTERAFSCKKGCGRTYKTRKNCNAHEKRCDGRGGMLIQRFLDAGEDRPFSCRKGCGRAYKTRRTLRGHEKTCSGNPFVAELGAGRIGQDGIAQQQQSTEVTTMTVLGQALQASMEAVMGGAVILQGVTTVTTLPEGSVPEAVVTETVVTKTEFN